MKNVEKQFQYDWLTAARWIDGRVDNWNQLFIQVVHTVVGKSSSAWSNLVADLHHAEVHFNICDIW